MSDNVKDGGTDNIKEIRFDKINLIEQCISLKRGCRSKMYR